MPQTLNGTIWGGVTFSVSPAKKKVNFLIAKGSDPWFNNDWLDIDKVTNVDESISGQATVTCKGVTNMQFMFNSCSNLTSIDLSNFDTSKVSDMSGMTSNCDMLDSLNLSNCNISNVVTTEGMCYKCYSLFLLDLSFVNTSTVTVMREMFLNCSNLNTIKGVIDMKSCRSYYRMFYNCSSLYDVKIRNPPAGFDGAGLSSSQYTIVS